MEAWGYAIHNLRPSDLVGLFNTDPRRRRRRKGVGDQENAPDAGGGLEGP